MFYYLLTNLLTYSYTTSVKMEMLPISNSTSQILE